MNKTNPSSNEWLQFFQLTPFMDEQLGTITSSSDAKSTIITTDASPIASHKSASSPARVSKSRRRSRASNKTPITLLNASTLNFRSMVQQYTGCSKRDISFGNQSDLVNLDFGLNNATPIVSVPEPFGNPFEQEQLLQQSDVQGQHSLLDNFSRTPVFDSTAMNNTNLNYMEINDYENIFMNDNTCYYDPCIEESISTNDYYWNDGNYLF